MTNPEVAGTTPNPTTPAPTNPAFPSFQQFWDPFDEYYKARLGTAYQPFEDALKARYGMYEARANAPAYPSFDQFWEPFKGYYQNKLGTGYQAYEDRMKALYGGLSSRNMPGFPAGPFFPGMGMGGNIPGRLMRDLLGQMRPTSRARRRAVERRLRRQLHRIGHRHHRHGPHLPSFGSGIGSIFRMF